MSALIVGFDGSLTAFGWSIVMIEDRPRVILAGCICTKPDAKSSHQYAADKDGVRVDEIAAGLLGVLRDHVKSHDMATRWNLGERWGVLVAIEAPAGAQHAASAKALGLAYGIARTVCMAEGHSPITVQAHEVKRVCGGSNGASKQEVADGVHRLTGWRSTAKTGPAREGESDAVGVALTAMRHPVASALRAR